MESATSLAAKIRRRELTSEQLVTYCIERINETNPGLNAVVDDNRFESSLEDARIADRIVACLCDKALEALAVDAPLLGVPFSTKEGIRVRGMKNSYGSPIRANNHATSDADAVRILRKAGGIPLCVTNVSELGTWWESSNSVYGTTNNPYDARRTPGGSSGGEAALQAVAGVPIGLGSDTGGSIRTPSSFCGIFGHKPTPGFGPSVRGSDIVDPPEGYVSKLTALGPMVRYSEDLLLIMKIFSSSEKLRLDEDVQLSKLRYFYLDTHVGGPWVSRVSPEIKQSLMRVVYHLEDCYGINVLPFQFSGMEEGMFGTFMMAAAKDSYSPSLEHVLSRNLWAEWALWMIGKSNHNLPFLVSATMEVLVSFTDAFWPRSHKAEMEVEARIETMKNELIEVLRDDGVLLCPTHPTVAPFHCQSYFKPVNIMYVALWNLLGMPATSVPVGLSQTESMPIGIQIVASPMNDRLTITVAQSLERPFGGWVPPFPDNDF